MTSKKKIAVVTGGAGFIGSHMVDLLLYKNYHVRVIDNLAGGHKKNLKHNSNNPYLKFNNIDICKLKPNNKLFKNADYVFHFAGVGDIVPSIENPVKYMANNVQGTVKVLEAARYSKVKKFIYAASASCYGINEKIIKEDSHINLEHPYALSKYLGEKAVFHWNKVYGLSANSIRIFNAYGPRVRTTGAYGAVIGVFFKQKIKNKPLTIVGDGKQSRDFVHVTDVVRAFLAAAKTTKVGKIYNIGTGKPQTVNYLSNLVGGRKVFIPNRPGEPKRSCADISKIRRELKWKPKIKFRDGIFQMLSEINQWKDAPLWTPQKIQKATKTWFSYLSKKIKKMFKDIQNQFSKKIIEVKRLKKIIGEVPRKQKIILCHGHFDVVHPGHVRHLTYAKSKAAILVVSVTADVHIKKEIYRPFVPENLRALNLAAYQMVDYVIIDNNQKPLKNLSILKPDFFAKGFEYSSGHMPPATKEEAKVVESYGGQMIFTPGDIVYSSTKLLNISQPKIVNEKLIDLMSRNKITFNTLRNILKKFKNIKVHVIGDTIIDTYTRTNLIGGNTKTPTTSVLYQEQNDYIGGAGIVAQHLRSAGAKVYFTTILGNDNLKSFVLNEMKKSKISVNAIIDNTRPTTNKNTIISGGYKLLKIDKVDNQPISEKILKKIKGFIKKQKSDVVIFSDFRHGIFNKTSISDLISSIKKGVFKAVDSQVATRWGNITDFNEFDLITPNEREARFSLADQDSSISILTRELIKQTKPKNLILKLGARGIVSVSNEGKKESAFSLPSFANQVADSTGTGDALLSYATLSMFATKSLVISSILGSLAAACECEVDGNINITTEHIISKINSIQDSSSYKISNKV